MSTAATERLKQPPVFKLSCLTVMCERFGFYVLTFFIVLYAKNIFNMSDTNAFILFGVFQALAYLATAAGGYLADNVFGIRRCLVTGLFLEATGLTLLSIPCRTIFPISLAMIIIGVGLFKTAPTHLLGRSYKENDPRVDSGFTLYYMCINIGSLISSTLVAILQKMYGYDVAFLVGGLGLYCGLLFYFLFRHTAIEPDSTVGRSKLPTARGIKIFLMIIAGILLSIFLVSHPEIANIFLVVATIGLFAYFLMEIIRSPKVERFKIAACLSLIAMGLIFFILYQQAYTSMVLFVNRSIDRHFLSFEIPTVCFFALNPFWVIVLGPLLASFYKYLSNRGGDWHITFKFPLGLLITSGCFWALVLGAYFANSASLVASGWMVLAYFLYTLGEMLVSALGVAMVTHIAPKRMYGVMMGAWFVVGMSLASALSGVFAGIANVPDTLQDPAAILHIYTIAFAKIGAASTILALLCFVAGPYIKRMSEAKG